MFSAHIKNRTSKTAGVKYTSALTLLFVFMYTLLSSGCEDVTKQKLWSQIKTLDTEKADLKQQVKQLEGEKESLLRQITKLTDLGPEARLWAYPKIERVNVRSRTGIFDKDKDGTKETLIVYVQPFDASGDAFKAAGSVEVELWNLNSEPDGALLKKWVLDPGDTQKLWVSTMMTNYYRLKFDVAEILSTNKEDLTINVIFFDFISGKVFRQQVVIEQ
jgi:outer membrane murein-binding lipoprotein Lpp